MFVWTSKLGFGCADLLSRVDRKPALRFLEHALDQGISHFDVGRSYGDGRAEWVLGELVARRRRQMTIVTKAGIEPPTLRARILRRVGRAGAADQAADFRPYRLRRSVEASLKALHTDHIDALLLHECRPHDVTGDVVSLMEALRWEGKIGAVGLATSYDYAAELMRRFAGFFDIVQTPYEGCADAKDSGVTRVIHSVFKAHATAPGSAILRGFSRGDIVLFSSCSFDHIEQNARLAGLRSAQLGFELGRRCESGPAPGALEGPWAPAARPQ